jgi:hypothetical protein
MNPNCVARQVIAHTDRARSIAGRGARHAVQARLAIVGPSFAFVVTSSPGMDGPRLRRSSVEAPSGRSSTRFHPKRTAAGKAPYVRVFPISTTQDLSRSKISLLHLELSVKFIDVVRVYLGGHGPSGLLTGLPVFLADAKRIDVCGVKEGCHTWMLIQNTKIPGMPS